MFEGSELGRKLEAAEYEERVPALREALLEAQDAAGDVPVVVVVAGVEGAGKGDVVNLLLEWLDPRGVAVHALGPPTPEERERPALWRFWRLLPGRGEIAIFPDAWYAGPILERALGDGKRADYERSLDHIAGFEGQLVEGGTLLVKLWLHVSRKEQKKRFEKLESDPDTAWRVTPRDWELYRAYGPLEEAAREALRHTDTGVAPWHVIEAANRRFRNVAVGSQLLESLRARLSRPAPAPVPPEPLPVPEPVNPISRIDLSASLPREDYEEELSRQQGRLGRLSRRMAASECSAVLVFEGNDAAGKGGAIRRVAHGLDARFYRVIRVAAPDEAERARPYPWRFWRHLPRHGHFTLFDRSWYGRVLVERIEGLAAPPVWRRAYAEIRDFEEQLTESGVVLLKYWLAISAEEQLRRFEERQRTGHKRYKITGDDWRNREKWGAYEAAAAEMVERTSTRDAPWTLVAAEDKRHARIQVLRTLCEALEAVVGADEPPGRRRKRRKRKKKG